MTEALGEGTENSSLRQHEQASEQVTMCAFLQLQCLVALCEQQFIQTASHPLAHLAFYN